MVEHVYKSEDLKNRSKEQIVSYVEKVIKQYLQFIKSNVELNVRNTKEFASLILPNIANKGDMQAIDLIIGLLKDDANIILENQKREDFKIVAKDNSHKRKDSKEINQLVEIVNELERIGSETDKQVETNDHDMQNAEIKEENDEDDNDKTEL